MPIPDPFVSANDDDRETRIEIRARATAHARDADAKLEISLVGGACECEGQSERHSEGQSELVVVRVRYLATLRCRLDPPPGSTHTTPHNTAHRARGGRGPGPRRITRTRPRAVGLGPRSVARRAVAGGRIVTAHTKPSRRDAHDWSFTYAVYCSFTVWGSEWQ